LRANICGKIDVNMTIAEKYKSIVKDFGSHTALAYLSDDHYKKISYNELNAYRRRLADRWNNFGWLKGEKLALMLPNSPEWIISDLAAATLGIVIVPIHTTYNSEYIEKLIKHSDSKYLVIHRNYFDKHKTIIEELNFSRIIVVGDSQDLAGEHVHAWPMLDEDKKLSTLPKDISDEDVHTIIYTSGTTGDPKGVMITHKNFVLNTESSKRSVYIDQKDRFFSFLPLSHAFERVAGYYSPIFSGASIYFARSKESIIDDIKKAKPTVINSVPRIFEKIYGKVFDKIDTASDFKKKVFFKGLQLSVLKRKHSLGVFKYLLWVFLDFIALRKVRAVLGGRLRMAISGGASLDMKMMRFFENLGINIIEGYGMTEAAPIITVNSLDNSRSGTVGRAPDCNEVIIAPDKEILVRGSNIMAGYYKNKELTDEVIDKNGWLHTGDLGFMDKDGFLTIIGRAKDVIVLSTGKNIFPEAIENILNESRYISQSMVYGDNQKHVSALLVPNFEQLKKWCAKHNLKFDLDDKRIQKFYEDKINQILKDHAKIEQVSDFKLLAEEFSQENGFLTPTLKLKRYKILKKYCV
jgi:long-chain acyl-CoA synthetase